MGKLPILIVACLLLATGVFFVVAGLDSGARGSLSLVGAILAGTSLIAIAITLAHPPWPPEP